MTKVTAFGKTGEVLEERKNSKSKWLDVDVDLACSWSTEVQTPGAKGTRGER